MPSPSPNLSITSEFNAALQETWYMHLETTMDSNHTHYGHAQVKNGGIYSNTNYNVIVAYITFSLFNWITTNNKWHPEHLHLIYH